MFQYTKEQCAAMSLLYRAQMYCMTRALRQRNNEDYRRAYNDAAIILLDLQEAIGKEKQ